MGKFRHKFAFGLMAIAIAGVVAWYLWSPGQPPPGQPPLASLTPRNFNQFTGNFNSATGEERLVLLLSPT